MSGNVNQPSYNYLEETRIDSRGRISRYMHVYLITLVTVELINLFKLNFARKLPVKCCNSARFHDLHTLHSLA